MKERPILFSGPMVRAILDGRKTQTRRVVKSAHMDGRACPHGIPGDQLWVRETWADACYDDGLCICYRSDLERVDVTLRFEDSNTRLKFANWAPDLESGTEGRWRSSIHMPRWASRITLEITGIRVERLQDISEEDAKAEGSPLELGQLESTILGAKAKYRSGFVRLWQSINGPQSWQQNPWVWVIEFRRIEKADDKQLIDIPRHLQRGTD